ncbi:PepSY-associated TM helix domain-containing protein [Bacillus sp. FJAT-29814]|uniref:PepSY-associated TM helix domain-containing protein n=1 Tax=Bacillus sp. FJAT-29814 TaxID=1729688 RepID=UPI000833DACC|nr:PepSY-associated TM helix domain-containing protein [Bacillus sp. FJAT-29814]
MKRMRQAHLWIGLIASVLIFMESLTGLLMNEPWLIGQTQMEGGRGNFQQGQMMQGQVGQGMPGDSGQTAEQAQGQMGRKSQGQIGDQSQGRTADGQFQGRRGFGGDGAFASGPRGEGFGQGSMMSIIRGLHEGRIGTTDVKWLIDLTAVAMMFLTGSGIYLSIKILAADRKRKKRKEGNFEPMVD